MAELLTLAAVGSREELNDAVESVRRTFAGRTLWFRGQTARFPTVRSGRCPPPPEREPHPLLRRGYTAVAARSLGLRGAGPIEQSPAEALLQVYGHATRFVDLTDDPAVAAFFACHERRDDGALTDEPVPRALARVRYEALHEGEGCVLVLGSEDPAALEREGALFDLSGLPEGFARPRYQRSVCLDARRADGLWLATIPVDRRAFRSQSPARAFFPHPADDPCLSALRAQPYVLVPAAALPPRDGAAPPAEPALAVQLLRPDEVSPGTPPPAADSTLLCEPHPIRAWPEWHFHLERVHADPALRGDLARDARVTLSPGALTALENAEGVPLAWPDFGLPGVFFSFAPAARADGPLPEWPARGVWLHGDASRWVEHPTEADDEGMTVLAGHAYALREGGKLVRLALEGACGCGRPEAHDRVVTAMLRLDALLRAGELALLPHPLRVPDCYVVV